MHWKRILLLAAVVPGLLTAPAAAVTPATSARSAVLMDGDSGRVLYASNAQEERAIASITKIMTALVALESVEDLGQTVTIQAADLQTEGSSMYLKEGEQLTFEELMYGLLLSSGNDAALAVARVCAGDVETFVSWMNQRAESLGMDHTHFTNPNGLTEEGHYSSAEDMAILTREALQNDVFVRMVSTKTVSIGGRELTNHNKLLWNYAGAIGVKTGYTEAAGRTLVSAAVRNGQTLIAVTLDDSTDWEDHTALLDYGFSHYPAALLCHAGKAVSQVTVADGEEEVVALVTASDVYYPLAEGEQVRARVTLPDAVSAPVEAGAIAGQVEFLMDGQVVGKSYLVFETDVERRRPEGILERIGQLFRPRLAAAAGGAL